MRRSRCAFPSISSGDWKRARGVRNAPFRHRSRRASSAKLRTSPSPPAGGVASWDSTRGLPCRQTETSPQLADSSGARSARNGDGDGVVRKYVLDTHACVFMLTAPRKLGRGARAALERVEAGRDEVLAPAAVVAEVLVLRGLGRVSVGLPELRRAMDANPGFRFLPLDLPQLDEFAVLATIRDPFDRLIVSAARNVRGTLITRDRALMDSGLVE